MINQRYPKYKRYNICEIFNKKNNSNEILQINKKNYMDNWFPSNSAALLIKDVYYQNFLIIYRKQKTNFN